MRIPSGVTDQYIYFVAVDATDFTTRETGFATWTVYRSRDGAAAAAMTTPTINETDATNMPGVYELLLDEDMTIGSGNDSEEMAFHITHAGMAPVTRVIELYRPKITAGNTLGVASDGDISGNLDGTVATVTTLTGHTNQTGDNYARLGAPAGASVSADIADVPTVSELNARTLVAASYFDPAADTVANVTTVATLTGHTAQTGDSYARLGAPAGVSVSADIADIPTVSEFNARTITAAAYFDPAADTVVNVTTVATLTGHTAQTGDNYARLGAPAGASVSADIADVPTVSEFNARTIASASYFDPTADTVANVTNVAALATDSVDAAALATDAVNEIRDAVLPTQNATFNNLMFLFVAASDHVTPVTGASGTAVTRSIDGGAFGAGTGTLAEVANGIYQYDASAADMNGGIITFRFTGTGGTPGAPDDAFVTVVTGGGV